MSHVRQVLVVLALIAGSLAACKKDASTTGAPAKEAMGLYAKGFNALLRDPKASTRSYFSAIPETGPELKGATARIQFFPHDHAAADIKEAREAFAAAKQAAPESMAGLAPAADQALAAIEKFEQVFTEAKQYYEAENYKDDQLAKGKQLHAQIATSTKDFNAAMARLGSGLSKIEDDQAASELAKYEADKGSSYWFRFYNIQAKKFLDLVEAAGTPAQLEQLAAAFPPIASANEALAKFVATKGDGVNWSFANYAKEASSFHATATKLIRLTKEPKLDGAAVDQVTEELVRSYNALINLGNALYQVEAVKPLD